MLIFFQQEIFKTRNKAILSLFVAFLLFYLAPLASHGLWIPDETRYAQISQEMLLKGNWITPHFMGLRYFEKPVAGYWLIAISQAIFGQNLFGVRFASALSLGLSVLLTYGIANRLWSNWHTSFLCSIVYMSLCLIAVGSGYANLDPQFTLWLNLSGVMLWLAINSFYIKPKIAAWAGLGIACGMGFMTKGFLAFLLPTLIAVPYMIKQRKIRELICYGWIAIVFALLISLPWALTVHFQEADFWNYFFWDEHIRHFTGNDTQHAEAWWYYLPLIVIFSLPWLGFIPSTLIQVWRNRKSQAQFFLWLWFLMPFLFLSIAKDKLPSYIMPCMLPMALLIGYSLAYAIQQRKTLTLRTNGLINVILGIISLIVVADLQLRYSIYANDTEHLIVLMISLHTWTLINALAVWQPLRFWAAPALAMCITLALLPAALPSSIVYAKTSDIFIEKYKLELQNASSLLSNELGTASTLAWHAKNPYVTLFNTAGEAQYDFRYADTKDRFISIDRVRKWISDARRKGSVGVAMRVRSSDEQRELDLLPRDGKRYKQGSMVILIYDQDQ